MVTFILLVLIFCPLALTYFLKSNAALAFLALCAGETLLTHSGSQTSDLLNKFNAPADGSVVNIALLVLPLLLGLLLTHKSFRTQSSVLMQFVPAISAGALLALLAGPDIASILSVSLDGSGIWDVLQKLEPTIVAIGVVSSLLLFWTSKKSLHKKH
jgi:hypothetical protein